MIRNHPPRLGRQLRAGLASLCVPLLLGLVACSDPSASDDNQAAAAPALVVHNIHGYTSTETGEQNFSWLSVDAGGRVMATGSGQPPAATKQIDGDGHFLLPGLIDAHGHVQSLGLALERVDLVGTTSKAEAVSRIQQFAADHPDLDWILGRGWNQELWFPAQFPSAADIDAVVPDRPVLLTRIDGHAAWVNSAALKAVGISADTPDPDGGFIHRTGKGQPSGILVDTAEEQAMAKVPAPDTGQSRRALANAMAQLLSEGITSTHDAGIPASVAADYQAMATAGELPMRIYVMLAGTAEQDNFGAPSIPADNMLVVRAVKLVADGALGSRGAALQQPYTDDEHSGLLIMGRDALGDAIRHARTKGYQVNIHAIGDLANREALDAYAAAGAGADERHRIEHAQIVDLADIPRFKAQGIIPSMQATHATSDKNMAAKRLGDERLAGAYAWRRFLDQGSRIANGSDFPVERSNPFEGLYAAITRQDLDGQPPGGWMPEQRMTRAEAIRSFTLDAAYAAFQDDSLGSLEPGKFADFILVDRDLLAVPEDQIPGTQVLGTWVAGKQVYAAAGHTN